MNLLVDTNVISYTFRKDTRASAYERRLIGNFLEISLAELNRWSTRRDRFVENYLIIYPDGEICSRWASVVDEFRRAGNPIGVADAWVAAVALEFDIPLVTHNRRHFEMISRLNIISEDDS